MLPYEQSTVNSPLRLCTSPSRSTRNCMADLRVPSNTRQPATAPPDSPLLPFSGKTCDQQTCSGRAWHAGRTSARGSLLIRWFTPVSAQKQQLSNPLTWLQLHMPHLQNAGLPEHNLLVHLRSVARHQVAHLMSSERAFS